MGLGMGGGAGGRDLAKTRCRCASTFAHTFIFAEWPLAAGRFTRAIIGAPAIRSRLLYRMVLLSTSRSITAAAKR